MPGEGGREQEPEREQERASLLDDGERLAVAAEQALIGLLRRAAAVAAEAAEDIWAEAQSIRRERGPK